MNEFQVVQPEDKVVKSSANSLHLWGPVLILQTLIVDQHEIFPSDVNA